MAGCRTENGFRVSLQICPQQKRHVAPYAQKIKIADILRPVANGKLRTFEIRGWQETSILTSDAFGTSAHASKRIKTSQKTRS